MQLEACALGGMNKSAVLFPDRTADCLTVARQSSSQQAYISFNHAFGYELIACIMTIVRKYQTAVPALGQVGGVRYINRIGRALIDRRFLILLSLAIRD